MPFIKATFDVELILIVHMYICMFVNMYLYVLNHIRPHCLTCQQCETSSKESMKPAATFPPATKDMCVHMYMLV